MRSLERKTQYPFSTGLFILLVCALTGFSTRVTAQQEKAALTGLVADSQGSVVPGANVVATGLATGVKTATVTNAAGYYYLSLLPGEYALTVSLAGFATARVERVLLTVNQTATIDIPLQIRGAREEVTVTDVAPLLEQRTASLGTVIDSRKILELPIIGRNPYTLVELSPGVNPRGNPGSGPIINGGRSNSNAVLLDGQQVLNSTTNDVSYTPPLESVSEFKVQTNSFSAEFGRTSGGVINTTTRRGTNKYQGSLYEFLRNDALNANSYTNNYRGLPREVIKRHEFGGTLGGPVSLPKVYEGHDKTFFFVNVEGVINRSPQTIIATVPTELERRGDFSQTFFDKAKNQKIIIYDPNTSRPDPNRAGRFIRDPFPGNIVPPARLDPVALKVLQFFPLPNSPGDPATGQNNYLKAGAESRTGRRLLTRVDHVFSDRNTMFVRYGFSQENRTSNLVITDAFPRQTSTRFEPVFTRANSVLLGDTHTFSPTTVGEFRLGVTRARSDSTPTSLGNSGFDLTSLGFTSALAQGVRTAIFPRFDITDEADLGPDSNAVRFVKQENAQAQASLVMFRGRHSLKTGIDLEVFRNHAFAPSRPSGQFTFTRGFTQGPDPTAVSTTAGHGLATFLLGIPGGSITIDPALSTQQRYHAIYLQDTLQVMRRLSVDLGIRYEYTTPWNERFNRLAYFDPAMTDPLTGRSGTLVFLNPEQRFQTKPDTNNLAPRLGIAWEFMPRTVLRAGAGVFYAQGNGGIGAVASELGSGFQTTTSVFLGPPNPISNRPPAGSFSNPFSTGLIAPPSTLVGESIRTTARNTLTPYNYQWTASLQRQLTPNLLIETAYAGSRGLHLWRDLELNALDANYLASLGGNELQRQVANPFFGQIGSGALSSSTVQRFRLLLPYPQYTGVTQFRATAGDSNYHALTVKVDKRFANGFSLLGSYTLSKQINNVPEHFIGTSSLSDATDLTRDRSLADHDTPQRLVISYIWELPFGKGKQGWLPALLGGWQLSGVTAFQSGIPLVITTPNAAPFPGLSSRAVRLRSGVLSERQTREHWFDTDAFRLPEPFTLGNDSRTQPDLRGPGLRNFNASLARRVNFTEKLRLQFRAEAQNLFNHPQLDNPVGSKNSADFGRIISGGNPRLIQLGLRLTF